MDMQEAIVIGTKLGLDGVQLVNVDDLAGHLLDSLRVEFEQPHSSVPQWEINGRLLVVLLDMHTRLKDLENAASEEDDDPYRHQEVSRRER